MKSVAAFAALAFLLLTSCSGIATNAVADAFAGGGPGGGVWASDDDPELVRAAVPFGLKTMESLLQEEPEHEGLLLALASGFTQYGYAFVQADADSAELAGRSAEARALRERAKRLFLRARGYGLRALEVRHEGLRRKLEGVRDLGPALDAAELEDDDVPFLYWTAASWALAIASAKEDMELVAELPVPGALVERALALDESWNAGALHEFTISYAAANGDAKRARAAYDRALVLGRGHKLGPHVAFAESALVPAQDRAGFTRLLEEVVAADPDASPDDRLANLLAQRRARELLAHADDLFVE